MATLLFLSLFAPPLLHGQSRPRSSVVDLEVEWKWADYDRSAGFPGGTVREMVESGDTLWLRTDRRILWFAGFEWTWSGPGEGVPTGRTTSISPLPGGGLLAVIGGQIYMGGGGGFVPLRDSLLALNDYDVSRAVHHSGAIVFTATHTERAEDGLYRLDASGISEITPRYGLLGATYLWLTRSGSLWVAGANGLITLDGDEWAERELSPEPTIWIPSLWDGPNGDGFVYKAGSPSESGLFSWSANGYLREIPSEGLNWAVSGTTTEDGAALAVYETGDVRVLGDRGWRTIRLPPARADGVHFAYAERSGDIWFASARGLHLFRPSLRRWTNRRLPFPDVRNRVSDIVSFGNGETWLGTGGGVVVQRIGRPDSTILSVNGTALRVVTGLALDSAGQIWVTSGASFDGAFRLSGGRWEHFGADQGLDAGKIHRVRVSRDGSVWFLALGNGSEHGGAGVYRMRDGSIERIVDERGWLDTRSYDFAEDTDGSYWFATRFGISRWDGATWSNWGVEDGIGTSSLAHVFTLLPDAEGGVFFGHGPNGAPGLGRLAADGSVTYMGPEVGGPSEAVNQITRDSLGVIWFSSENCVGRYSNGEWSIFDGRSGLNPPNAWPIGFDDRGVLFGTDGAGLMVLDRGEENNPPPRVRLLGPVSVQGRIVRIRWRAVSYRGEVPPSAVLTRDRIDGGQWSEWATFRDLWTDGGDDLAWGDHTIEIQAKGLFGQVSEPLVASFTIPNPVYLRAVFLLPVGGLAATVLALILAARRRRVRTASAIRASEQRLRTVVESAPDGIAIYDVDEARISDANENALRLMGREPMGLDSIPLEEWAPPLQPDGRPSVETAYELIELALNGANPVFEWVIRGADGENVPVEVRLVRLPDEQRRLVRISMIDIRDRKHSERVREDLEEQLRQSQKLEAVGQLTGGIAHDFNNLLTVIMGNLELILAMKGSDPEVAERANGSLKAAERGALLTERLLAFSRRQTLNPKPVDVSSLIHGLMDLLERSLGETIAIHTRFSSDLAPAIADAGQLEHALINLAVNARDAMPDGGHLYIDASNLTVEQVASVEWGVEPGEFVVVTVTDTGFGMDVEARSKAFDPFFTTKEVGKGSGLGLSQVYGFVKQSGGFVRISSQPGYGTAVSIHLPRSREDAESTELDDQSEDLPQGNGERVLVVEDDARLLQLSTLLCERLGYAPIATGNGREALEVLEAGTSVDLLFTDVVLPEGMNGVELAMRAREIRPDLRVLFTSGYAEESLLGDALANSEFDLLRKPFDSATLSRKLRAALNREP